MRRGAGRTVHCARDGRQRRPSAPAGSAPDGSRSPVSASSRICENVARQASSPATGVRLPAVLGRAVRGSARRTRSDAGLPGDPGQRGRPRREGWFRRESVRRRRGRHRHRGATDTADDVLTAFRETGSPVVCVTGSDKAYAEDGVEVVAALRAAGASRVLLAGRPKGELADADRRSRCRRGRRRGVPPPNPAVPSRSRSTRRQDGCQSRHERAPASESWASCRQSARNERRAA